MSGIVGIVNLDGAPVDRELLGRMTDFMSFRGPDAQEIWIDGNVGFGHTMLRTTFEAETEKQPLTLDGKVWLTADARIDGREELIPALEEKLRRKLRMPLPSDEQGRSNGHGAESRLPNDAELILFAYEAWGQDSVKHLTGDFAFAIWDSRKRRLFCARDHFGLKPFYYARIGNTFVFSNTLNCLHLHPSVSDELNDLAIADFLLFGYNQNLNTTSFVDIQRLPPAHSIDTAGDSFEVSRYWTIPVNKQIKYKRDKEYVDHFRTLLEKAVADRLRTNRVALSMSGGLDSTSVAATAKKLKSPHQKPVGLKAFTMVYDHMLPDQERYYSGLAAEGLGIPIQYFVADNYALFDRINTPGLCQPEPSEFPLPAMLFDYLQEAADYSRVILSGDGGDPLMSYSWKDLARLVRKARVPHVLSYIAWHFSTYRRIPRLGYRETLRSWVGKQSVWQYSLPGWILETLTQRLDLHARLRQINKAPLSLHPERPDAYNNYMRPYWVDSFERIDPGVTLVTLETRFPFFDVRLVDFFLSLPTIPWCVHKEMIREAMKGELPEIIRRRPKTPLAGDQLGQLYRNLNPELLNDLRATADFDKYIDADVLEKMAVEQDSSQRELTLRAICLKCWLQNTAKVPIGNPEEKHYGVAR